MDVVHDVTVSDAGIVLLGVKVGQFLELLVVEIVLGAESMDAFTHGFLSLRGEVGHLSKVVRINMLHFAGGVEERLLHGGHGGYLLRI